MRGLQDYSQQMQPAPDASQMINPQNLALLLNAYKQSQAPMSALGEYGTSYGQNPAAGTGFGLGQSPIAGGLSGQAPSPYSNLAALIGKYRQPGS